MPLYDLMLLLDPGAPSDRHDAILKEVTGLLEGGGKIVTTQEWGTRRMTFEIDHRPEADYHLLQFETEPGGALLDQVDHSLKIMDGVLRHRIIKQKDGNVPPPAPRAEGRYAEAPPVEGAPAPADDTAIATSAGEAAGDAAAATPAGEPAAATAAGEAAGPAADVAAPSDSAPPTADPAADPVAGDAAPAANAAPAGEAAPAAEAAPVETSAPDASSLPPEEPAGDDDAPAGPAAA
jgi:ribosomal protein S6